MERLDLQAGSAERALEREVDAELAAHLELAAESLEADGHGPEEARRLARARFGDLERIRRECVRARLGWSYAMRKYLVLSNVLLLVALGLFALHARAERQRSLLERDALMEAQHALLAATVELRERAGASAPAHPGATAATPVVEVGDVIVTHDRHRSIDFGQMLRVEPDGKVLFEQLGWTSVVGLDRDELGARLTEAFAPFYGGLVVDVEIEKAARD